MSADREQRIAAALTEAVLPEMANRYVVVIETIDDDDGEIGLYTVSSESMQPWDSLGFLSYATHHVLTTQEEDN